MATRRASTGSMVESNDLVGIGESNMQNSTQSDPFGVGPGFDRFGAATHEVFNQPHELTGFNLFASDIALKEAAIREDARFAIAELDDFGARMGKASTLEFGVLANKFPPELDTHDRYGRRTDLVRFHPAYHALMRMAIESGLHASPWTAPRGGAHVARAAKFYMQTQVEAGHLCPITMTFASTAALAQQADLAAEWLPRIHSGVYDPSDVPFACKQGVTIGMAMTEKQGGSDVRANTTRALPMGAGDSGRAYELVGHKYFVSAPMSDAFLVLAQAPGGLSCFLMPRWRPDGTKNQLQIMRLKKKMGNVSNATSEMELRGALGWRVGPEGRGVATIIEMVAMTRFDCMIGSSAGMRMATAQAIDHCRQRKAFGMFLIDQPLMQNVLADLALESEASLTFTMRVARALDGRAVPAEDALTRMAIPLGKYWICKRAPAHAYEAMECIGGSGFMEDSPMPRLYREAPVNAIWEGSGNVQCLDFLRAVSRTPETLDAYFSEADRARGGHAALDRHIDSLKADLRETSDLERQARNLADRLASGLQASLLVQHAPSAVSDAFCRSRLVANGSHSYGALPRDVDFRAIIDRAAPR
jgi:putative acyl-CoA dehydrogenase